MFGIFSPNGLDINFNYLHFSSSAASLDGSSPSLPPSLSASFSDRRAPALCSPLRQFPCTGVPAVDVTLGSFQFRDFRWVRFGGAGADPVQQLHEEAHQAGTGPPVLYLGCSVGFLLLLADLSEVQPPSYP